MQRQLLCSVTINNFHPKWKILLDSTWIEFIEDNDGRGEGIHSFNIKVKDSEFVMKKAEELNLVEGNQIIIGGVIFTLS